MKDKDHNYSKHNYKGVLQMWMQVWVFIEYILMQLGYVTMQPIGNEN